MKCLRSQCICCVLFFVAGCVLPPGQADELPPFPQNRVRDFYARQARHFLDSDQPPPEVLSDFPGLDGGSFGHWGQNPEADNFDYSLNAVDIGQVLSQVCKHFGRVTSKAVIVRLGTVGARAEQHNSSPTAAGQVVTALFDPQRATFVDAWRGGFVRWQPQRYGITSGVTADGNQIAGFDRAKWNVPPGTTIRYLGYYRHGPHTVFSYRVGGSNVYEAMWLEADQLRHGIYVTGAPLASSHLVNTHPVQRVDALLRSWTEPGAAQWAGARVTTQGKRGSGPGPYIVDTLTIPYRKANPFGTPMRIGGFDFLPDGRAVVATLMGDVWLVDGIDAELRRLTWQRIAAGLNQPLGLVVREGQILVLGRDQVTRLHDRNGDYETDFYECLTHDYPTAGGNSFALTLHQDRDGTLYWFTRSDGFGMTRHRPGQSPESIATGLRGTNGTGVSRDGSIVLATAQEGTWTPASAIFEVHDGSYHGFGGPRASCGSYGYDLPLCFIPRGIDNSCGDLIFLPEDRRFGPLAGAILGTSFGYCQNYVVLREPIAGTAQGGVTPLPWEFLSGSHRLRFNRLDGCLYVAGTDGWQSYARENGSLQRVRYVTGSLNLARSVKTYLNGFVVEFNCEIDPTSVRTQQTFCEQWNYLYSEAYGSPEFSARRAGRRGHDPVAVRSVHLLPGRRAVFVEIPHLHPVMQFHLFMRLQTGSGEPFDADLYLSVFHQRGPFTEFAGYRPVARKRHYPDFPQAEQYPRDPRLLAQEALGKTVNPVESLELNAVPGLQYEPLQLRVPPGRRTALTLHNTDPSMSHNVVVCLPDRLQAIGDGAMKLAADPRGVATHYVPQDPGVLCFSPILQPGEQYSIYFDSPKQKGAYPFVCTFPGHWKVMQGVLYVLDPDEPMPEQSPFAPLRKFVKMWKTEDLSAEAERLQPRSIAKGAEVFRTAGCTKCHTLAGEGEKLGPDLTKVNERFRGAKLLQQILEPSSEINKDYRTALVMTMAGRQVTGLITKQTEQEVVLLPNPLEPEATVTVPQAEIDELSTSPTSTMPEGLLMTYTRDEILDLLWYVQTGGMEARKEK